MYCLKNYSCLLFTFMVFTLVRAQSTVEKPYVFEKTENFTRHQTDDQVVSWGKLKVPEDWSQGGKGKSITLAITVIKGKSEDNGAVLYLPGGPGGNSIDGVWMWLNHPIREKNDIILMDLRGTGYSEPSLCPDLGKSFMKVLAEDYSAKEEIDARVQVALQCRDALNKQQINPRAYNSLNVVKDLHALKEVLSYKKWSLYGVSYGTRIALEYAFRYPEDLERIVFDSQVLASSGLYDQNTSNFLRSLNILFNDCDQDPQCRSNYGNLQESFHNTLNSLSENPVTVGVPSRIHPSEEFTLNAQDFLVAVQQSLYEPVLYEVLPIMITEFGKRNKSMITALVNSMAGRLSLDYGTYYSMLCNEILPLNSLPAFKVDSRALPVGDSYGLPFYEGDYFICNQWFSKKGRSTYIHNDSLPAIPIPALIISGEFDPVTPPENGRRILKTFPNSQHVVIENKGHTPGFYNEGKEIITMFLSEDFSSKASIREVAFEPQKFVTGIQVNGGIYKFAMALFNQDMGLIIPLGISLLVLGVSLVLALFILWKKRKDQSRAARNLYILIFLLSLGGLLFMVRTITAILSTAENNFYVLAFGLPDSYNIFFMIPYILLLLFLMWSVLCLRTYGLWKTPFFLIYTVAYLIFLSEIFIFRLFL